MNYKTIDINNWARREHYQLFRQMQCSFSITVDINISNIIQVLVSKDYKLYPTLIYLITKAINQTPAFKMSIKAGELVEWNNVHPSYTIFHKDNQTFSGIWTEYHSDFNQFMKNYVTDQLEYKDNLSFLSKPDKPENTFDISCLPWVSFTGFTLSFPEIKDYFKPIITIGKYRHEHDQILLPLAIQIHHAVCDGFHIGVFLNQLQQICDEFDK